MKIAEIKRIFLLKRIPPAYHMSNLLKEVGVFTNLFFFNTNSSKKELVES